jgi:hypothetical protein
MTTSHARLPASSVTRRQSENANQHGRGFQTLERTLSRQNVERKPPKFGA